MRAWRQSKFGEPRDVLRLDELPEAGPAEDKLVVAPEAVGVNMPDLLVCQGGYQELPPFPFILGSELAGTVIDPGSAPFAPGQRVMALARLPDGALAEQVPVLIQDTVAVPDGVSSEVAASIPVNYVTAYLALHIRARLVPGETVLVQGGAGGVGSAAVQLALAHGARVIATAVDEARAETCRKLGAELVLNPRHEDVVSAVLDHTGGRGVEVAIDPVGGDAFDQCRRTMAFEGRLVVVGFAGDRIATLKTNHPVLRNYGVLGVNNSLYLRQRPDAHRAVRKELLGLAAAGQITPLIHGVWPFRDAPSALGALADGVVIGKALVRLEAGT
jgi:NADPH2:quinone reductase